MGWFSNTTKVHEGPGGGAQGNVEKAVAKGEGWRALVGGQNVGDGRTKKEALAVADREARRVANGERG